MSIYKQTNKQTPNNIISSALQQIYFPHTIFFIHNRERKRRNNKYVIFRFLSPLTTNMPILFGCQWQQQTVRYFFIIHIYKEGG